jgi:hypothetical protein
LDLIQDVSLEDVLTTCHVGTGSTAPAEADVALEVPLATTASNGGFPDLTGAVGEDYARLRRIRVFGTAEANGALTEVGFSEGAVTDLFTRQLFRDGLGDPTVINKTSDFELRVTYELRLLWDNVDEVQVVDVTGSPENVTRRRGANTSWVGMGAMAPDGPSLTSFALRGPAAALGAAGVDPTGGTLVTSTVAGEQAYVPGTYTRDYVTHWGASVANDGTGYNVALLGSGAGAAASQRRWQFLLPGPVSKVDTERLVLEHTVIWGREEEGS